MKTKSLSLKTKLWITFCVFVLSFTVCSFYLGRDFQVNSSPTFAKFLYLVGMLFSVLFSFLIIFCLFIHKIITKQFNKARVIMSEIQGGNLKARFPVIGVGMWAQAMTFFNQMIDRLEESQQRSKRLEQFKSRWLQELAHDLRTPLASLGISLSTLQESKQISENDRETLIKIASTEASYMQDLVEDLLLLGLMNDSEYFSKKENVNIVVIFEDISAQFALKAEENHLSFKFNVVNDQMSVQSNPKLVTRAIRNALENAFYYSKTYVRVDLAKVEKNLEISFINDVETPLSADQIEAFGRKRAARLESEGARKGPQSLGLGSVVIREIVTKLSGHLLLENFKEDSVDCVRLTLTVPLNN